MMTRSDLSRSPQDDDTRIELYQHEDEIDLIDLGVAVYQRRFLALGVFLGVIALTLIYLVFFSPETYRYTTTIEIGSRITEDNVIPIEAPAGAVEKLNNAYIPAAIRHLQQQNGETAQSLHVEARQQGDSALVQLRSEASQEMGDVHINLQQTVADMIKRDHSRITDVIRTDLETSLEQARITLDALQDETTLLAKVKPLEADLVQAQAYLEKLKDEREQTLERRQIQAQIAAVQAQVEYMSGQQAYAKAQIERLGESRRLLEQEIADIKPQLEATRAQRAQAVQSASEGTQAMTLMLIDTQIQEQVQRLADLEQLLAVALPGRIQELQNQIAELGRIQALAQEQVASLQIGLATLDDEQGRGIANQAASVEALQERIANIRAEHDRNIQRQQNVVAELEIQLENFRDTRTVLPPQRSLRPVGYGNLLILVVGIFAAVLAALFAVFAANFLHSVRQRAH